MTAPAPPLIEAHDLAVRLPDRTLFEGLTFTIGPGLSFVRGGDGRGKTTLLQVIAGRRAPDGGRLARATATVSDADPRDRGQDAATGQAWLDAQRAHLPGWDPGLCELLVDEFAISEHIAKPLYMWSTGSRRKLGWVVAFAGGADLAVLDTPYGALDAPSRALLDDLLLEAASHPRRVWVVADYTLPDALAQAPLSAFIDLGD